MSRVVELQLDWMKDPAFAQEFAKLEEELRQLKAMARTRGGKAAPTGRETDGGRDRAALAPLVARSA